MKIARPQPFAEAWATLAKTDGIMRLLVVICLGTFGFGMADVLLEPYGGQALGLSVADTTKLTALFASGTLLGFGVASKLLSGATRPANLAMVGAAAGVPGFLAIILAALGGGVMSFLAGVFVVGVGAGLFSHATLTAMMRAAPPDRIGLSLGAWGAAQATAAGVGVALAGIVRDIIVGLQTGSAPHLPYNTVFMIEAISLLIAIAVIRPLARRALARRVTQIQGNQQVEAS